MSRFGDLLGGQKPAPAPAPVVEEERPDLGLDDTKYDELVEEEVVEDSNPDFISMSKDELEEYGRELGVELDKRHSKKRLISEIEEVLDNS
mgnify:CR=1 FL=1